MPLFGKKEKKGKVENAERVLPSSLSEKLDMFSDESMQQYEETVVDESDDAGYKRQPASYDWRAEMADYVPRHEDEISDGISELLEEMYQDDEDNEEQVVSFVRDGIKTKFGNRILLEKKTDEFQEEVLAEIENLIMEQGALVRSEAHREKIKIRIKNLILGHGPLELLYDRGYSEIMVSRYDKIFVEENGKMKLTDVKFGSEEELVNIIQKLVAPLGREINSSNPTVDGRLEDGSRFNAVLPPIAVDGAQLTIRRFPEKKITAQDYLNYGSLNEDVLQFLKYAVHSQWNIIVSGGTGSGKTTLLNLLSNFLDFDEGLAVLTIEDSCELRINHPNVRRYETRAANASGQGAVTSRDLVKNSLRVRPDSIIIGEIRDGTMADFLRMATSGHDGCLTTVHNDSPEELENTIQVLFQMAKDFNFTEEAIKRIYCSAVDIIVQIKRFPDHVRRITHVSHVVGYGKIGARALGITASDPLYDPHECYIRDIFRWEPWGFKDGKFYGDYVPTGYVPEALIEKARDHGVIIDPEMFVRKQPKHKWNYLDEEEEAK